MTDCSGFPKSRTNARQRQLPRGRFESHHGKALEASAPPSQGVLSWGDDAVLSSLCLDRRAVLPGCCGGDCCPRSHHSLLRTLQSFPACPAPACSSGLTCCHLALAPWAPSFLSKLEAPSCLEAFARDAHRRACSTVPSLHLGVPPKRALSFSLCMSLYCLPSGEHVAPEGRGLCLVPGTFSGTYERSVSALTSACGSSDPGGDEGDREEGSEQSHS